MCTLVVGGDLERTTRAGRVFLEDQCNLLSDEPLLFATLPLRRFQLRREVQQIHDLVR